MIFSFFNPVGTLRHYSQYVLAQTYSSTIAVFIWQCVKSCDKKLGEQSRIYRVHEKLGVADTHKFIFS